MNEPIILLKGSDPVLLADAAAARLTTLVTGFLTHLGDLATGRVAR